METITPNIEIRSVVAQCLRTLTTSAENKDVITALQTLQSYLDEGSDSRIPSVQRAEFRRVHFTRTLRFLVSNIQADWVHSLKAQQRKELWDGLFLKGPADQTLLVLMEGIGELRPSINLDHLISITERFLQNGGLAELLWSYCLETGPSDSPQLRETLQGRIVGLPDLLANKLQLNNKPLFLPQQYYPLLATEILSALENVCQALRNGTDCSLTFVAQVLGKVCVQGQSALVFSEMAPRLSIHTRSDMVWQRVCWKLLQDVPQRCMESVLTGLVQSVSRPDILGRIIGNIVLTNKKAQFVITHKLLLLQYKYETRVLRVLLGYLAADRERRPLLIQVLRAVSQAWANPSAVKHTPIEQQLYVSKALLLSVNLLDDSELHQLQSDLLQCMLGGMQSHLDSSVVRIRHMGMVVGECLSSRMDISETKLKFEYDQDDETRELLSLMTAHSDDESDPEPVSRSESPKVTNEIPPPVPNKLPQNNLSRQPDPDLDSDDELTPYDMSDDQEMSAASPPRYLRDCLETLISSEDPMRVELSLIAAEDLVRKNVFAAREISVELTKVLLHMENKYNLNNFLVLRQATMVALTVIDCIPVTQYLTTEFYSLNYSLRQRLDMLEVLVFAARELSSPVSEKRDPSVGVAATGSSGLSPYVNDKPVDWRQEVEKRIQSKTRRLRKGVTQPAPEATPNRYAPVAGHFFFPLLRNYDRPQVTFDLLGSDHLVLGRLIHTLGVFMHLAVNAPVATQMGRALLDFVWSVRYHVDQTVRRGVLFAVCSLLMSVNSQNLLADFGDQLFETRSWLAGRPLTLGNKNSFLQHNGMWLKQTLMEIVEIWPFKVWCCWIRV
uniref:Telomere length regulation protein TEL2 homolog n=1 Tax=Takifugu rubripes TaxID=31033 RepID=H2UMT0_TAKRU